MADLLAAACFARASPALHRWLLHNHLTGPWLLTRMMLRIPVRR